MTLRTCDWLAHHARRTPKKLAFVDRFSQRRYAYGEIHERSCRLAGYLHHRLDVSRGDRVALLAPNSSDIFEIHFACARLGAILVPLNTKLTVAELEFIVGDAGPKALLCDLDHLETGAAIRRRCGVDHMLDWPGDGTDSAYEQAIVESGAEPPPAEFDHSDLSTIIYTSGTTGRPKGAMITHAMTFYNAVNLAAPAYLTPDSVQLTVLPLFHTAGLNLYANPVVHAGGTVIVTRAFDPIDTLRLIGAPEHGVTHFFGVPAVYLALTREPSFANTDLSRLRVSGIGGSISPMPLLKAWADRGVGLQQVYGMTETGPSMVVLDVGDAARKLGAVGKPVLHAEIQVMGTDGTAVERGEIGELWIRGPNVTPGYWNRPEANRDSFADGWLRTGDAVSIDEEGFYYVVDRWKDMYISGGENVYPAEIERVIQDIPAVAEAAVVGLPDARWGETGCAVVVREPGDHIDEETVIQQCRERLAAFKLPRSVVFTESLPRNAAGKILKRKLKEWLLAQGQAG